MLIVVVNAGTLSASAVMMKLNGVPALPEVAWKNKLKSEVAPGARFAAPGTANGGFSSPGTETSVAPDAVIPLIDVIVTLVAATAPVLVTAINRLSVVPRDCDCTENVWAGAGNGINSA